MSYKNWSKVYPRLPYAALDAVVTNTLEYLTVISTEGDQIPITIQWIARSAGSPEHRVTDPFGREFIRVRVRLLPEEIEPISVVDFQTQLPEPEELLYRLDTAVYNAINQDRQNVRESGGYTPSAPQSIEATLAISECPDPDTDGWNAVLFGSMALGTRSLICRLGR